MVRYKLSDRADKDLDSIIEYTYDRFGKQQSIEYGQSLTSCFEMLADFPYMGTKVDEKYQQIKKHPHQSHIILFHKTTEGIFIVRILGKEMDVIEHLEQ